MSLPSPTRTAAATWSVDYECEGNTFMRCGLTREEAVRDHAELSTDPTVSGVVVVPPFR